MYSFGLKANVIGTLTILLVLAIFLSDVVIIMFWQRGLIEAEIRHVRSYLSLWTSGTYENSLQKRPILSADLESLCKVSDAACIGTSYFDGHEMVLSSKIQKDSQFAQSVRLAALSGNDVVRFDGASWGVITFTSSRLIVAVPIAGESSHSTAIGMLVELQPVYQSIKGKQEVVSWYMFVNVLLLTAIGFFRFHHVIIRPIERLVKISETYGGPEGQLFFSEKRGGEFGQLSMALNSLLFRIEEDRKKLRATVDSLENANMELVKTQKEMIRTEKLAAIGRLSAGLAHEVGNPIGIVQGYLELLGQSDILEDERRQFSSRAVGELERISRLIRQLLDFSRSSPEKPEPVNIRTLLDELVEIISSQQKMSSITFIRKYDTIATEVIANPDGLRQVFLNCILNAVDAIKEKGNESKAEIVIAYNQYNNERSATGIRITISDNGMGIKEEDQERIFDPFFTTKEPGKGTGLGLSVSYAIIEAAGGKIWVESIYTEGTSVTIELPLRV
jgi:two-component system, NtrC family, sensor kinase